MSNNNLKTKNVMFWSKVFLFSLLFLVIGIFGYKNMYYILKGSDINFQINKTEVSSSLFDITGVAKNTVFISLNGREIFINQQGEFNEKIALPEGFSVITVLARDKFGKNIEKTVSVYTNQGKTVALENRNNKLKIIN